MIKKALKITIFLTIVLVLFSSCAKKVEDCKFLPKIQLESQKNSESDEKKEDSKEKLKNMLENRKTEAHITCKF